jgi:hypothetical protein
MAWKHSALADLMSLRKRGHRPDHPVVIADTGNALAWAKRNQYCAIDRRDVAEDLAAFAGLDVWVLTARPFAEVAELGFALTEVARYVTLVDSNHRTRSEFL